MEGIDDHDLAFAILEVSHAVQKVGDDNVTGNHRVGKYSIFVVFTTDLQRVHGLFFQVLETHFLRFGNELFLVKADLRVGGDR